MKTHPLDIPRIKKIQQSLKRMKAFNPTLVLFKQVVKDKNKAKYEKLSILP